MSLHKDPWVMQRVNAALDAIRHADEGGLETELNLLAFAEDILDHFNSDIWQADKRATALAGVIARSEAHLREALGLTEGEPDPGLEAMAGLLKRRTKKTAVASCLKNIDAWRENRERGWYRDIGYALQDVVQSHYYDLKTKGSKPDDPGWHECSCGWEGYWSSFQPHVADHLRAVVVEHTPPREEDR